MKTTLVLALALVGFNAQAATIIALFNGEQTSDAIQRFIVNDPTNPGWVDTTTGEFSFTRTGGTEIGALSGTFFAFCIEPREFVSQGTTYTYDFSYLEQGTTNIGGMGAAKADLLRELFGRYYPDFSVTLDAEHASALQIAIWEIVRETSGTLSVSSGNISFRNPADAPALALAQTYLSSLDGTGPKLTNLYALDNVGAQDVIVQVTGSLQTFQAPAPEPATLATMGVALIAISLMLRRRRPLLVRVSKTEPCA
jgi:hypothetical protein